jgi:hypothetical protein
MVISLVGSGRHDYFDFVLDVLKDDLDCRESEDYEDKKNLRDDSLLLL